MRLAICLLPLLWLVPVMIALLSAAAAAFLGMAVEWMEPAPDGLRVIMALPDGSISRNIPLDLRMMAALLLASAAFLMRRTAPLLAALTLMATGRAAASGLSFEAMFQQRPWAMAAVVGWTLVAALGVHWCVSAEAYHRRLMQALVIFVLPVAIHQAWQFNGFGFRRMPPFGLAAIAAGMVTVALAGALRRGMAHLPRRQWVAAAAVAAIMIPPGVSATARYSRDAQRQRLNAELAGVKEQPAPETYDRVFFQRGVSFIRDGFGAYYPERSARMLDSLRSHGVDSIALVPYGRSDARGPAIRFEEDDETGRIYTALGHLARARGIRILLKPQLLVFGPGMFPGSIDIPDPDTRREWFANYQKFILHWARIASTMHADLFCVGTELARLSRHEDQWRELIRQVRMVYPGPLVYAATQGEEFEQLKFWDALDFIGLNNYYPLPDSLDTSEVVRKVEAVQARYLRPVIFTELGFASVEGAHRQPWAEPRAPVSLEHQERCYRAVFEAFYHKPWFQGMYWWKISADGRGGPEDRSLTPWRKPAMQLVRRWYTEVGSAGQGRGSPPPSAP